MVRPVRTNNWRKFIVILILFVLSGKLYGLTGDYVYKNTLSSTVDENQLLDLKIGNVYSNEKGELFLLTKIENDTAIFQTIYSKGTLEEGLVLEENGNLKTIFAIIGSNYSFCEFVKSTKAFPLELTINGGITYDGIIFFHGGIGSGFQLSSIFSSTFPLIENGRLDSFITIGLQLKSSKISLSTLSEFSYSHFLGSFYWKAGISYLDGESSNRIICPFIGGGIRL
ncbi:MAG: hypothetical protein HUK24_06190 [Sphaerochaetaceae bacterium]|nr:hypothetical protein [Sphaerochaetaceae bacterium]